MSICRRSFLIACFFLAACVGRAQEKKKLKIVFMFGQSEMVGQADIKTAVYMLQKPPVIPKDVAVNAHASMKHQINGAYLYWQAMNSYGGPAQKKAELKSLIALRSLAKATFKQHVLDELTKNNGMFRGKKYTRRRGFWLFNMCDEEVEKQGITPKIRAYLDAPDNKFNVEAAYDALIKGAEDRYAKQQELNAIYLKGTKADSFPKFETGMALLDTSSLPSARRDGCSKTAQGNLRLPIAKRTYISCLGTVLGTPADDAGNTTKGKLSIGYGANVREIGLEYAAGMALERSFDGPILIVKCAWLNGESIRSFWRASSMDGIETTYEKRTREAWNKAMLDAWNKKGAEDQKKALAAWEALPADTKARAAKPGTPRPAPAKTGRPGRAWQMIFPHLKKIVEDPKKYHPDYDADAGYEMAGMVWFQGLSDRTSEDYGQHLAAIIKDFRTHVKAPAMPVVCATVGTMHFKGESDDHPVNSGMREVANMPEFKGTVQVVETYKHFPAELSSAASLFHKRRLNTGSPEGKAFTKALAEATTKQGRRSPPYLGAASFFILAGDEVGTKLAQLIEKPEK